MNRAIPEAQQSHAMNLVSYDSAFDLAHLDDYPFVRRPSKSSPLLSEIISILESTCQPTQAHVLDKAAQIKNSNTSLASSTRSKRKNIPLHEPALNILHSLSNVRDISQGIYGRRDTTADHQTQPSPPTKFTPNSRFYDEALYYLMQYGSHTDIITFLVRHNQLDTALKYFVYQKVDADIFVQCVFMPYLKRGLISHVIGIMLKLDETMLIWKRYVIQTCQHLERKSMLNCLYHLQVLLNDPVRASMTCVKFYTMNCATFQDLVANSLHLVNAQRHLQTELELYQWEEINVTTTTATATSTVAGIAAGGGDGGGMYSGSSSSSGGGSVKSSSTTTTTASVSGPAKDERSLLMKMDTRSLNSHINTIWRQIEVCKFLAKCEQDGRVTAALLPKVSVNSNYIYISAILQRC